MDGACDCTSHQNLVCRIDTGGAPFALGASYSDWFFRVTPRRRARMPLADSFTGLDCYRVSSSTDPLHGVAGPPLRATAAQLVVGGAAGLLTLGATAGRGLFWAYAAELWYHPGLRPLYAFVRGWL